MRIGLVAAVALLLAPAAAQAAGRELHWDLLDVDARLDGAGDLHVVERQVMVLTGDWNGGERTFRVERWQRLRFERLSRVDERGAIHEVERGDLDRVDHYELRDGGRLRWRSRAPSDPPFRRTALTYVLEYTIARAVVPDRAGGFRLAHDFAFADRPGIVREVRARLTLDPEWEAAAAPLEPERIERAAPLELAARDLPPGRGAVLVVPLRFAGAEPPEGLGEPETFRPALRWPLRAAMAAALLLAVAWVVAHGRRRGLFRGPVAPGAVDEAWLRAHVLSQPAEAIGAAWDGQVGGAEVSAVLARLALEGKLAVQVEPRFLGRVLRLRLLVARETLHGDERRLVQGLFPRGDASDSETLRRHYRRTGFDPARKLTAARERAEDASVAQPPPAWPPVVAAAALLAALAWLASRAHGAGEPTDALSMALFGWPLLVLAFSGAWGLATWRRWLGVAAAAAVLPFVAWGWAIDALAGGAMSAGPRTVLAHLAAWSAGLVLVAGRARTRLAPETLALRRRLETARRYFARELARPAPRLRDEWIPYLIALELGGRVDRWLKVHAPGVAGASGESTGGASYGAGWSGGGGRFSGGGASGSWAALGSLASVSAPSSSSGGSGGGSSGSSGGSSSGGGGGGGW